MKKILIISIMVLAFLTLTKNANGQNQELYYNYSNTSNCSWDISFYDISMNQLHNYTISAGSAGSSSCAISISASVAYIQLVNTGGSTCTINFGNCSSGCQKLNVSAFCGYFCSGSSPT